MSLKDLLTYLMLEILMALPSPVAEVPDLSGFLQQIQARSSGLGEAAWAKLRMGNAENAQQAAYANQPPPPAQGAGGYAAGMEQWQGGTATPGMTGGNAYAPKAYSGDIAKGRDAYNNRLRELGVPDHVIEGNAWNVEDESGWKPSAVGDGGQSFGYNQWYDTRKQELFDFAKSRGMDPGDPVLQADNWYREMTGGYKSVYEAAVNAGTANGAADVILRRYEIPAKSHMDRRSAAYSSRQWSPTTPQQQPSLPQSYTDTFRVWGQ